MRVLLFFIFDLLLILIVHSQQTPISADTCLKNENYSADELTFKKQIAVSKYNLQEKLIRINLKYGNNIK